ncbi:dephospho-CoA kinase [Enterococcus faecalis]|uniref:dephospho-CoA kinase n=1 Tax=Enterococcus faecalis TaxID=1351 RepID=UPI0019294ACA|nr:dephospho-CoA kinase [Enterococcus faecalis]EHB6449455.1 dephospho-CoA kinase [Enterococcus faecalis]MDT2102714.1 dephospho-CoA kinase [Enterococcus faecalis]WEU33945.1 dephospho-CoA kinase [Enterococcus faecalis]
MTKVLGITGGIATGKSAVVALFKKAGYPIVDGDIIAREIVAKGQPALAAIVETFGPEIVLTTGELDRKKLGQLIFANPQKRELLNETLKPFLRKEILRQIEEAKKKAALVIVDIPLLYEAHYEAIMDQVAVVYVPEKIQKERLMARNQLTEEEAQQRIDSQWPIEMKKERADIVFDNQGTREETEQQVKKWLEEQTGKK